jgi:outer membrane protein assembly factor BamD
MIRTKRRLGLALLWILLGLTACSSRAPRVLGLGPEELLAYGFERMERRRWDDAILAFEQFTFQYPTHARYQEARYQLGEVYFRKREHITAATEFARLADDYPTGPYAAAARFRVCEAYRELAPRPQLDQLYTVSAIEHCQSLIAYYPQSEYVERARAIVAEMTDRLAEKQFLIGEHYYRRRAYDSAVLSYNEVLDTYPTSSVVPRTLLRLYQSYRQLGYDQEAADTRERLLRDFPDTEAAREVRDLRVAHGA